MSVRCQASPERLSLELEVSFPSSLFQPGDYSLNPLGYMFFLALCSLMELLSHLIPFEPLLTICFNKSACLPSHWHSITDKLQNKITDSIVSTEILI
jgi:hypothetical protein